ncbi:MAG: VOC family protein [Anaerolineaceae bacterium]|nr:VOC family protein [Anaerolineaceae bacterium]
MARSLFSKIDIVAYTVSDWQRAKKFYGETLGLPVAEFYGDEVGWMEFGPKEGAHLSINLWEEDTPFPPRSGAASVVFMVEDADETAKELRARGVKCNDPVTTPGMVRWASFFDPDGNELQFASPIPEE